MDGTAITAIKIASFSWVSYLRVQVKRYVKNAHQWQLVYLNGSKISERYLILNRILT